jgi:hypothetical protein
VPDRRAGLRRPANAGSRNSAQRSPPPPGVALVQRSAAPLGRSWGATPRRVAGRRRCRVEHPEVPAQPALGSFAAGTAMGAAARGCTGRAAARTRGPTSNRSVTTTASSSTRSSAGSTIAPNWRKASDDHQLAAGRAQVLNSSVVRRSRISVAPDPRCRVRGDDPRYRVPREVGRCLKR